MKYLQTFMFTLALVICTGVMGGVMNPCDQESDRYYYDLPTVSETGISLTLSKGTAGRQTVHLEFIGTSPSDLGNYSRYTSTVILNASTETLTFPDDFQWVNHGGQTPIDWAQPGYLHLNTTLYPFKPILRTIADGEPYYRQPVSASCGGIGTFRFRGSKFLNTDFINVMTLINPTETSISTEIRAIEDDGTAWRVQDLQIQPRQRLVFNLADLDWQLEIPGSKTFGLLRFTLELTPTSTGLYPFFYSLDAGNGTVGSYGTQLSVSPYYHTTQYIEDLPTFEGRSFFAGVALQQPENHAPNNVTLDFYDQDGSAWVATVPMGADESQTWLIVEDESGIGLYDFDSIFQIRFIPIQARPQNTKPFFGTQRSQLLATSTVPTHVEVLLANDNTFLYQKHALTTAPASNARRELSLDPAFSSFLTLMTATGSQSSNLTITHWEDDGDRFSTQLALGPHMKGDFLLFSGDPIYVDIATFEDIQLTVESDIGGGRLLDSPARVEVMGDGPFSAVSISLDDQTNDEQFHQRLRVQDTAIVGFRKPILLGDATVSLIGPPGTDVTLFVTSGQTIASTFATLSDMGRAEVNLALAEDDLVRIHLGHLAQPTPQTELAVQAVEAFNVSLGSDGLLVNGVTLTAQLGQAPPPGVTFAWFLDGVLVGNQSQLTIEDAEGPSREYLMVATRMSDSASAFDLVHLISPTEALDLAQWSSAGVDMLDFVRTVNAP